MPFRRLNTNSICHRPLYKDNKLLPLNLYLFTVVNSVTYLACSKVSGFNLCPFFEAFLFNFLCAFLIASLLFIIEIKRPLIKLSSSGDLNHTSQSPTVFPFLLKFVDDPKQEILFHSCRKEED